MNVLALLLVLQAQSMSGDAVGAVRVIQSDEPVNVVALRFVSGKSGKQDVSIEAKNVGPVALKSGWFTLAPPDCPKSKKAATPILSFGAPHRRSSKDAVAPGATFSMSIPGERLEAIEKAARREGCPDSARPDLVLGAAVFIDGRKWSREVGGEGKYTSVGK